MGRFIARLAAVWLVAVLNWIEEGEQWPSAVAFAQAIGGF